MKKMKALVILIALVVSCTTAYAGGGGGGGSKKDPNEPVYVNNNQATHAVNVILDWKAANKASQPKRSGTVPYKNWYLIDSSDANTNGAKFYCAIRVRSSTYDKTYTWIRGAFTTVRVPQVGSYTIEVSYQDVVANGLYTEAKWRRAVFAGTVNNLLGQWPVTVTMGFQAYK